MNKFYKLTHFTVSSVKIKTVFLFISSISLFLFALIPTYIGARESVGLEFHTVGASTKCLRRRAVGSRYRHTKMGTALSPTSHRTAKVRTFWLLVRMVYLYVIWRLRGAGVQHRCREKHRTTRVLVIITANAHCFQMYEYIYFRLHR